VNAADQGKVTASGRKKAICLAAEFEPPKRRGMNERQIAFDQRLQAIRITMARPGFETFSIRGFWTCAAGSLHVLASIEALQPHSHQ